MRRRFGFVGSLTRRAVGFAVLGTAARVDVWNMMTDLMQAGLDMGTALEVTIGACRDQGQGGRGVGAPEMERCAEGKPFSAGNCALGAGERGDASAGRGARRCDGAVRGGGADRRGPGGTVGSYLERARDAAGAGGWNSGVVVALRDCLFIPAMLGVAPRERWDLPAQLFGDASLWVYENDVWIVVWSLAGAVALAVLTLNWTGRGGCSPTASRRFRSIGRSRGRRSCSW